MEPSVARSPVLLTFGPALIEVGGVAQLTRGFNGAIPGPTIRTAPGERLRITLHNTLFGDPSQPEEARLPFNDFKLFNTTTLHTHGLHVSPRAPADDVFLTVEPGASRTYEYEVPAYHMGGTHWYHPHIMARAPCSWVAVRWA